MKNITDRIMDKFEILWGEAEEANKKDPLLQRFYRCERRSNDRIDTIGIYDYYYKKYILFDMINTVGNKVIPPEIEEMEKAIKNANA